MRGTADLESVIRTAELSTRPPRDPDIIAESEAILHLLHSLDGPSEGAFQSLAETARALCDADSAGVSILQDEHFRWRALAGRYSHHRHDIFPRDFSPWGAALDRSSVQLFTDPGQHYQYLQEDSLPILEMLTTPIYAGGAAIGTLTVMLHDERRRFDSEDARILENLSRVASAMYRLSSPSQRSPGAGCGLHILVVDDIEDAAESLAMLLRMEGHEVRTAYEGPTAVRNAAEWCPDVVMQDIGMPGMTGYEVARALRRWSGTKGSLLIAMSGSEEASRSIEAGFDHHLVKPVDFDDLRRVLARVAPQTRHAAQKASAA